MNECMYCQPESLRRSSLMTKVCDLPGSVVYLFRDQRYAGRVVVASRTHFKEIFEMSEEQRCQFFNDVAHVAQVLTELFHAEKINYSIWGDKANHTHVHLVPKTQQQAEWGKPFLHDPDHPIHVDEHTFQVRVDELRKALELPSSF
ncbi:MAG: HIT family protein [Spirochaetae bacterium HGW-Spirochaetae-8]|nr:MAG: HIT family protein [Spirochaetae bacterium HGW-Spirochaetae-8]